MFALRVNRLIKYVYSSALFLFENVLSCDRIVGPGERYGETVRDHRVVGA